MEFQISIRRLQSGDEVLWLDAVRALVPAHDRDGRLASVADVADALADGSSCLFVALLDERPVGFLAAFRIPDVERGGHLVYLYDIMVDEGHRRRGTGATLIAALAEHCRANQISRIWAGTALNNWAARRTFEATGAELEGVTYAEYEWILDDGVQAYRLLW